MLEREQFDVRTSRLLLFQSFTQKNGLGATNYAAGSSDGIRRDETHQHGLGAIRRAVGTSEEQGHDKTRDGFRYSKLDKGKSKHACGPSFSSFHGPSNSKHVIGKPVSHFEPFEPIFSTDETIFNFNTPKSALNSLQSQPSNQKTQSKDKPISFSSPPQQPPVSSSEISICPHLPKSKSGNDKHSMGGVSVVQSISKLEDSAGRSVHSD